MKTLASFVLAFRTAAVKQSLHPKKQSTQEK